MGEPVPGAVRIERVEPGTPRYLEAAEVRYEALYAGLGLSRDLIADTDGRTYTHVVAILKDAVVGYARLLLDDAGEGVIGPGEAKIFQVSVASNARGTGVGRALVDAVEDLARRSGVTRIILDARLESLGFYERLGYEAYGDEFLSPRTATPHIKARKRLSSVNVDREASHP